MTRKSAIIGILLALASPLSWAAPRGAEAGRDPASIPAFVARIRGDFQKAPSPPRSFQEAVSRVVPDLEGLPRCLTPVIGEVRRQAPSAPAFAASVAPVLGAPALARESTLLTDDGVFELHYTLDRQGGDAVLGLDANANGVPDYVDTVASALTAARRRIVTKLGFRDPFTDGPIGVYLANLGGRIDGYTLPASPGRAGFIVIDSRLLGNDALLRAAVAHQLAHAALDAYDAAAPAWWAEATASWLEGIVAGSWAHYSLQIRTALAGTAGGLGLDDFPGLAGRLLWPAYLSGRSGGASVVRSIWETLDGAGESSDLWAATDEVLGGIGSSIEEAFADYSLWLQLRRTAQEVHAEPVPYAGDYTAFPAAEIQTATPLAPFGATYLHFATDGLEGGLRLSFEGDAPGRFQAQLLLTPRKPGAPLVHAVVSLDTRGHGSIGIPWATYGEAVLIVGNVMRGGAPATYSFVARPDPTFPFELTSLAADAEQTDVRLTWETRSESGLFGWIVYRSEQSNGPPHRVNDLIVPAIGDGDGPVAYQYLDDGVARGGTYYYRVVGITHDGLIRELPETRVDFPK